MKKIYIQSQSTETFALVTENNKAEQFVIDRPGSRSEVGNIYRGRVRKVDSSIQAAFVDYGHEKLGFLQKKEIPASHSDRKKPIQSLVHEGQAIWIQVIKDQYENKGAQITGNITLPGAAVVYLPYGEYVAVSKKLPEMQRELLKQEANTWCSQQEGMIVRTSAASRTNESVYNEFRYLQSKWQEIAQENLRKVPFCIYEDREVPNRLLRSIANEEVLEIIVDEVQLKKTIETYYENLSDKTKWVNNLSEKLPYSYNQLVEHVTKQIITLPSGISLHFDLTEAMTVIDVNSAKFKGRSSKREMILQVNKEASREIARQLKLRNISGIILIDFIDMKHTEDQQAVIKTLQKALATDKVRTEVMGFTKLGILEMTRKREGVNLSRLLLEECQTCNGQGIIVSPLTNAYELERELLQLSKHDSEAILVEINEEVLISFKENIDLQVFKERLRKDVFAQVSSIQDKPYAIRLVGSNSLVHNRVHSESIPIDKLL